MITPALYTFYNSVTGQQDLFHDDRFNLPQEAAAKLAKTNELYQRIPGTWAACFNQSIHTAESITTAQHPQNIRWFYTFEETAESLTLSVQTRCPTQGKALFFKDSFHDVLRRFSPLSKPLSAVYTLHDAVLQDTLSFLGFRENSPQEAAFRFQNMEKLYNVSTMTYPAAFVRANHYVEFTPKGHRADYLYTLLPSEDEDAWEDFVLKAYSHDTESRLFFEGSVSEFITLYES